MANGTVKHTRWGDGWKQAIEAAFPPTATGKKEVTVLRIPGRSFDATVVDERWSTYKVIAMLPRFPAAQEERFMEALRRNPELSLALRHHTQPESALDFAQANGLAFYFAPGTKLSVQCSCGSRGYVCPHARAALLALGDRIDKEPFLLFSIRGIAAGNSSDSFTFQILRGRKFRADARPGRSRQCDPRCDGNSAGGDRSERRVR